MKHIAWCLPAALLLASAPLARAQGTAPPAPATTPLDRVVVRWHARETGGPARPQFIFERELAFEARLEALADPDPEPGPYHERHVRAALDRHLGEAVLAALTIVPMVDPRVIAARAEQVERGILEKRVHGRDKLLEAAQAEGIGAEEISDLLRRRAKASLYIDKMIVPMLEPDEIELRNRWRSGSTPFTDQPFDQIKPALALWYVEMRVAQEREAFFQNARSRLVISISRRAR